MEHVIELEDITAAYDRQPVLWDLDLNIPKGSLMGIVGPNGAGKSTLLKIILNLLAPVSGRIRFSIDDETDAKKHGGKSRMSRRTVQSTGIFPPQ